MQRSPCLAWGHLGFPGPLWDLNCFGGGARTHTNGEILFSPKRQYSLIIYTEKPGCTRGQVVTLTLLQSSLGALGLLGTGRPWMEGKLCHGCGNPT